MTKIFIGKDDPQIHEPEQVVLCRMTTGENSGVVRFRIAMPDARCVVAVSIMFVPTPGQAALNPWPPDITGATTLWLGAATNEKAGVLGNAIPVSDVIPGFSLNAPISIPENDGLLGYAREFATAADNIEGVLTAGTMGLNGNWVCALRYQPRIGTLPATDWDRVIAKGKCSITKGRALVI